MSQALLSELARVKAEFQLRAILLHMGVDPISAKAASSDRIQARGAVPAGAVPTSPGMVPASAKTPPRAGRVATDPPTIVGHKGPHPLDNASSQFTDTQSFIPRHAEDL